MKKYAALFALNLLILNVSLSYSAGKPRPKPVDGNPVQTVGSNPTRRVILKGVGTKPFQLPNGAHIDLSADLESMLMSQVTANTNFLPTEPGQASQDCDTHLELRSAVTTLELNVAEFGVKFGYTPAGTTQTTITNITGKFDVKVGTVSMDFSVWECTRKGCSAVAATTSSHMTAGSSLSFSLDFGTITASPTLVTNTKFGEVLRTIMQDGLKRLGKSSHLTELNWFAVVKEVNPATGLLIFDQGGNSRLAPNQNFIVYASHPTMGVCEVFLPVASVHTTEVFPVSSRAQVDVSLDPRGIKEGDVVMIKPDVASLNN